MIELYEGDNLAVMKGLDSGSFDTVFLDPHTTRVRSLLRMTTGTVIG